MTFGGKVCLFKLQKGSKIDLLSKMCIFSENIQKNKIFKKSKKNLVVSKMEQNPFSCSIMGYETIIWQHQSQNPGFSYVLMPVHCALGQFESFEQTEIS